MFNFFKKKKQTEEKSKEIYCLVMFLFAQTDDQSNYVKGEAIKLLKGKGVIEVDKNLNISMTDETTKMLKKHFGIKFEGEDNNAEV